MTAKNLHNPFQVYFVAIALSTLDRRRCDSLSSSLLHSQLILPSFNMNYLSNPETFVKVNRAKGKATSVMKSVKKSVLHFPNRHEKDEKKKGDNDGAWWTGEGLTKRLSGLQKTSDNGEKTQNKLW
jgi:hypothetical protein